MNNTPISSTHRPEKENLDTEALEIPLAPRLHFETDQSLMFRLGILILLGWSQMIFIVAFLTVIPLMLAQHVCQWMVGDNRLYEILCGHDPYTLCGGYVCLYLLVRLGLQLCLWSQRLVRGRCGLMIRLLNM